MDNSLLSQKQENILKVLEHKEASWVPSMSMFGGACAAWAGTTVKEVWDDPSKYAQAMCKIYEDTWVDATVFTGLFNPLDLEDYFENVQNKFGPDGTTIEHVQASYMEANEYDDLIADPNKFVADVILPRKFPKFFEDREWAKEGLRQIAERQAHLLVTLNGATYQNLADRFGVAPLMRSDFMSTNPIDVLFDSFRGFKGTLTDIRRQPEKVKRALEVLWETRFVPLMAQPLSSSYLYVFHPPHIPAYLSPKQFYELYWYYQKQTIEWIAEQGCKLLVTTEGKWGEKLECFREVPKDSCILMVDDDDIYDVYKRLGDWQIM